MRTGAVSKQRLRWTPELQSCFGKAVEDLGGLDFATPKVIQQLMDVEGLTVYHVKSYLQKQRLSAGVKVVGAARPRCVPGCRAQDVGWIPMCGRALIITMRVLK